MAPYSASLMVLAEVEDKGATWDSTPNSRHRRSMTLAYCAPASRINALSLPDPGGKTVILPEEAEAEFEEEDPLLVVLEV